MANADSLEVNPWQPNGVPYPVPYPSRDAKVGDTVTFTWSAFHNVYINPAGGCVETGSILVGAASPSSYTFTEDDAGKAITFACHIPGHCAAGQSIVFNVAAVDDGGDDVIDTSPGVCKITDDEVIPSSLPRTGVDCLDNSEFYLGKKPKKNCKWISILPWKRQSFLCKKRKVVRNCPSVCNDDCCKDDRNCEWLRNLCPEEREDLCSNSDYLQSSCAMTCSVCRRGGWTYEKVEKILHTAIDVEMYTIPFYLTAVSSLKDSTTTIDLTVPDGKGGEETQSFLIYNVLMSVMIQEMFHMQLACNLANSMGVTPRISAPNYQKPPSALGILPVEKTRGNLQELLPVMIKIETPDPKYPYNLNSTDPYVALGPTTYQEQYESIGDLYHALAYMVHVAGWFETLHPGVNNATHPQIDLFAGKYNISAKIHDSQSALDAIALIVEQGEGNGVHGFMPCAFQGTPSDTYVKQDQISHYARFKGVEDYFASGKTLDQYNGTISGAPGENANLTEQFFEFVENLQDVFSNNSTGLNWMLMYGLMTSATKVWEANGIPLWN